jgi:hypothetical protein
MLQTVMSWVSSLLSGANGVGAAVASWIVLVNGLLSALGLILDKIKALATVDSGLHKVMSVLKSVSDFLSANLKH